MVCGFGFFFFLTLASPPTPKTGVSVAINSSEGKDFFGFF